MKLVLYKNKSANNTVNKELEKVVEFDGTLRTSTSITTPTITIELDDKNKRIVDKDNLYVMDDSEKNIGYKSVEDYLYLCNYAYIEDFKRYYYVIDVSTNQKNIYNFKLMCDTLMSYKDDIYKSNGFVLRNATIYNKKLYDDLLDVEESVTRKCYNLTLTSIFDNNFVTPSSTSFKNSDFDFLSDEGTTPFYHDTYRYVLTTAIVPTDSDYILYNRTHLKNNDNDELNYLYNSSLNDSISSDNTPNSPFIKNYLLCEDDMSTIAKILNTKTNITSNANQQCVISLISYPFSLFGYVRSAPKEKIRYGEETSSAYAYPLTNIFNEFCVGDYTFTNTYKYNFTIYDKFEMLLPFYGYVQLEYKQIIDKRLVVLYGVNVGSTNGYVRIVDITNGSNNGVEIFYSDIEIGNTVTINFSNAKEYKRNQIINAVNLGVSGLSSAVDIGTSMATFGVTSLISATKGVSTGGSAIANSIGHYLQNTKNYTTKIGNSINGIAYTDVYLKVTSPVFTNNNDTFTMLYGRPLNKTMQLSELKDSGYSIIKQLKLSSTQATKNEQDEIKTLLESGVYL